MSNSDLYCPDCGARTLQLIENTEPDGCGEYKECRTCPTCENMVYVVRTMPDPGTPTRYAWQRFMD